MIPLRLRQMGIGIRQTRQRRHLEDDLQTICVGWFIETYPDAVIYAVPNGGARNAREGARLKRQGVRKGVLDLHIMEPRGPYIGLWVESKADCQYIEKKTGKLRISKGRFSKEQKVFASKARARGYKVGQAKTPDEFKALVRPYMAMPFNRAVIVDEFEVSYGA